MTQSAAFPRVDDKSSTHGIRHLNARCHRLVSKAILQIAVSRTLIGSSGSICNPVAVSPIRCIRAAPKATHLVSSRSSSTQYMPTPSWLLQRCSIRLEHPSVLHSVCMGVWTDPHVLSYH
ncbi:hypothetical protein SCLCIDRAFT_597814 [Scleroderma citrinum Foug A]|uniref:Uncharacterized protein n=1 Tax=Scleroderma citrinum Foug A TaxID=1036808 RepID=A0A0C3E8Z2_9AGAM|nr:hypothetical protein SCLCIDRAFT_597814 [Scleroderma citrinum Foug A]